MKQVLFDNVALRCLCVGKLVVLKITHLVCHWFTDLEFYQVGMVATVARYVCKAVNILDLL